MRIYWLLVAVLWGGSVMEAYAQQKVYTFHYIGDTIPPTCNTFASGGNNYWDPWKSSHGSPSASDNFNQGNYVYAVLRASYLTGFKEKTEGLFISHKFTAGHTYELSFKLIHVGSEAILGFEAVAANGVTEKSSSKCEEQERPDVKDTTPIYMIDQVPGPNADPARVQFKATKDFAYLWMFSHVPGHGSAYGQAGKLLIEEVTVEDKGGNGDPDNPPAPISCGKPVVGEAARRITLPDDKRRAFGHSVAASGDYFATGALLENKVYVYYNSDCGQTLMTTLTGDDPNGRYGYSLDMYNDQLIVGDLGAINGPGSIYIYRLENGNWVRKAKIISGSTFGCSVGIYDDVAIVGTPNGTEGRGNATMLSRDITTGTWRVDDVLYGEVSGGDFGRSVDIVGNAALVGSPGISRIYFYKREVDGSAIKWPFDKQFSSSENDGEQFGKHVIISETGNTAFASGADGEAAHVIHIFHRPSGQWVSKGAVGPDGLLPGGMDMFAGNDTLLVVEDFFYLYVYQKTSANWEHVNTIYRPKTINFNTGVEDGFGEDMAMGNGYFLVGSPEKYCTLSGSVYLYDAFSATEPHVYNLCNKTYSGTMGTVQGRSVVMASDGGCPVTFTATAKATYEANAVQLKPGFTAVQGSQVVFRAVGCFYGKQQRDAAVGRMAAPAVENYVSEEVSPLTLSMEDDAIVVYPNPTRDGGLVVSSGYTGGGVVEVYDSQGVLIQRSAFHGTTDNRLNFSLPLVKGVYIIKVHVNQQVIVKKVINQ